MQVGVHYYRWKVGCLFFAHAAEAVIDFRAKRWIQSVHLNLTMGRWYLCKGCMVFVFRSVLCQAMADGANSNFCSLLISAVLGLFGLRSSCLDDRANSVSFSVSGANDEMLQLKKMS